LNKLVTTVQADSLPEQSARGGKLAVLLDKLVLSVLLYIQLAVLTSRAISQGWQAGNSIVLPLVRAHNLTEVAN
jgi:hypothetical protein